MHRTFKLISSATIPVCQCNPGGNCGDLGYACDDRAACVNGTCVCNAGHQWDSTGTTCISAASLATYILAIDPTLADAVGQSTWDEDTVERLVEAYASPQGLELTQQLISTNTDFQKIEAAAAANRPGMCDLVSGEGSSVSQQAINCMCGSSDPYVHCDALVEREFHQYRRRRRLERKQGGQLQQSESRSLLATPKCKGDITSPTMKDVLYPEKQAQCATLTCTAPIPKTPLEIKFGGKVCVPTLQQLSNGVLKVCQPDGRCDEWTTETTLELRRAVAEKAKASIFIKLCLIGSEELTEMIDFMSFLGIGTYFSACLPPVRLWSPQPALLPCSVLRLVRRSADVVADAQTC
jgi:hypothetical protein